MARQADAIVVGAGIVGAACALELARAGLRVLVLERGFAAGEATAAGMGHIVVMDDSAAQFALTAWSRRLWAELAPELPGDCEDGRCGTLWIAADEHETDALHAKAGAYAEHGVAAEVLDAQALACAEPQLRPGLAGALFVPDDRVIYPPAAARFLLARAAARGAELRTGCDVTALGARHVTCGGARLDADVIVNAAGAAAAALTPGLPVVPRRGHLVVTERCPGFCRHQLVELGYLASAHGTQAASVAFNVQPRRTGQLLIGSSREYAGFDARPDAGVRARLLRRAVEFLPGLGRLQALRTWVGFRPATPDKLPLVGRYEPLDGVWLAAGHEGLGITTALGSARLLADLVTGRTPEIDARPYAPSRLGAAPAAGHAPVLPARAGHGPAHASPRRPAHLVSRADTRAPRETETHFDAVPSATPRARGTSPAASRRGASAPGHGTDVPAPAPRSAAPASAAPAPHARVTIVVNGAPLDAGAGTTLAAALWSAGLAHFRTSVHGAPRGPVCAMGVCFECRVTVDGVPHRRACLEPCRDGMHVVTGTGPA